MNLTSDQQHIRNVAIRMIGLATKDAQNKTEEALIEDMIKVIANACIDLNRCANAMENIGALLAAQALNGSSKSPIIKPGG